MQGLQTLSEESVPRYQRVAEALRQPIQSGALAPGDSLPSFPAMKAQYGISQFTLERAQTILEREQLIVRQRGKGVFVAGQAQRKITGVLGCIGAGLHAEHNPYWGRVLHGIRQGARRAGRQLLLVDHPEQWSLFEKVDGVLVSDTHAEITLGVLPPGMPGVALLVPRDDVTTVSADDFAGAQLVTEHLLELGHRRIAFLSLTDDAISSQRVKGYRAALQSAGVKPANAWVRERFLERNTKLTFEQQGFEAMKKWLAEDWASLGCTALIAHNDEFAVGAMRALAQANLRVPHDVSVAGFDGTDWCRYLTPSLTTVEIPLSEIGAKAVELLIGQIEGKDAIQTIQLAPRLLKRASTSACSRS